MLLDIKFSLVYFYKNSNCKGIITKTPLHLRGEKEIKALLCSVFPHNFLLLTNSNLLAFFVFTYH